MGGSSPSLKESMVADNNSVIPYGKWLRTQLPWSTELSVTCSGELCHLIFNLSVCVFQWHALDRSEQAKYYEMARKEKELHMQMYPGWSARDNYATHTKKKKLKPRDVAALNHQHPQPYPPSSSPSSSSLSQHRLQSHQSHDLADLSSNGDCGLSFFTIFTVF